MRRMYILYPTKNFVQRKITGFKLKKLVKIEKPFDFEFRESKKDIKVNIDWGLQEKARSLYFELNF